MKPLTPAQQRVVDVMKGGGKLHYSNVRDCYILMGAHMMFKIMKSTINALKNHGVITVSLTLSPEYA